MTQKAQTRCHVTTMRDPVPAQLASRTFEGAVCIRVLACWCACVGWQVRQNAAALVTRKYHQTLPSRDEVRSPMARCAGLLSAMECRCARTLLRREPRPSFAATRTVPTPETSRTQMLNGCSQNVFDRGLVAVFASYDRHSSCSTVLRCRVSSLERQFSAINKHTFRCMAVLRSSTTVRYLHLWRIMSWVIAHLWAALALLAIPQSHTSESCCVRHWLGLCSFWVLEAAVRMWRRGETEPVEGHADEQGGEPAQYLLVQTPPSQTSGFDDEKVAYLGRSLRTGQVRAGGHQPPGDLAAGTGSNRDLPSSRPQVEPQDH
jgi:hypothetical protein